MRNFRRCLDLGLVLASVLAFAGVARAEEPIDAATKSAIQTVITKQLDALNREDGAAAEAFASQSIRKKFPDGAAFLAMVRKAYGALLHAKSTAFGQTENSPHGPVQPMTIVAADGTVWTAIYTFEKADGDWHITGCGLQRSQGQMDI